MNSHLMPSLRYSSCSSTNMWWLKNCCSFSLVKLMHSCSKELTWREGGQRDKLNHTDNRDGLLSVHAHYLEDLKTSNVEHSDEEVLTSL